MRKADTISSPATQEAEARRVKKNHSIPFNEKPGWAHVNAAQHSELAEISLNRLWMLVREGELEKPFKIGKNTTRWTVDQVRRGLIRLRKQYADDDSTNSA